MSAGVIRGSFVINAISLNEAMAMARHHAMTATVTVTKASSFCTVAKFGNSVKNFRVALTACLGL